MRGWDLRPPCPEGSTAVTAAEGATPATAAGSSSLARVDWREPTTTDRDRPRPDPEGPTRWYGWQILLSDAASLLTLTGGASLDEGGGAVALLGVVGYVGAPAVIHAFHDQESRVLGSLGLRVGMPFAGALVGAAAGSGCRSEHEFDFCQLGYTAMGFVLGGASAMLIDAIFAREPVPAGSALLHLAPQILVSDRETRFGVQGSF